MLIAIHGVKLYALNIHGVKLYAKCYTRGKFYAHCFTWIEASCSLLYMN